MFATGAPETLATEISSLLTLLLQRFLNMYFNRQSVTVVPGHVRRVVSHHRARLDDEVFENLVHRGTEMDVGVRVRWTIVENELLATCP